MSVQYPRPCRYGGDRCRAVTGPIDARDHYVAVHREEYESDPRTASTRAKNEADKAKRAQRKAALAAAVAHRLKAEAEGPRQRPVEEERGSRDAPPPGRALAPSPSPRERARAVAALTPDDIVIPVLARIVNGHGIPLDRLPAVFRFRDAADDLLDEFR